MTLRLQWNSRLKPIWWALFALLGTTFVVSALVSPGSRLLPGWRSEELRTVLPARIKPSTTFAANSELAGRVVSVAISPGTLVKAGQTLATLDSDELTDEIERARRRVKIDENRIAVLRHPGSRAAKRVETERYQSALHAKKAARERLGAYSTADMEKAWTEAKRRTAQIRSLLDQQLATASELDDALSREQDTLNALKNAREHWSRLKQEAEIADSQVRMARVDTSEDPNTLLAAQMDLDDAREALRQAQQKERAKTITARRAGTVLRVDVHPGDRVTPGEALFQIADLSELNFEVPVSASIAEQVHPGRAVVVRIPTDPPRTQAASVASVLLSPDQDHPSYIVRITIPNPNPAAILAGLEGAVEFPHLGSQWKRRPSY
jgi:multidrug efflux pump subunit AcrA (membrane-fusion protein)